MMKTTNEKTTRKETKLKFHDKTNEIENRTRYSKTLVELQLGDETNISNLTTSVVYEKSLKFRFGQRTCDPPPENGLSRNLLAKRRAKPIRGHANFDSTRGWRV